MIRHFLLTKSPRISGCFKNACHTGVWIWRINRRFCLAALIGVLEVDALERDWDKMTASHDSSMASLNSVLGSFPITNFCIS